MHHIYVSFFDLPKPQHNQDKRAIVRNISVPTLVIYGTDIPKVRARSYADAAQAIEARCKISAFPNVGHWPHLEAPDSFERELLPFLEEFHPA